MPKHRYRWWLLGASIVALVVAILAIRSYLGLRAWAFRDAAGLYKDYAQIYESGSSPYRFASCYGEQWDDDTTKVKSDLKAHEKDRTYRQAKAEHYRKLARKYERATDAPWRALTLDPPLHP